MKNPSFIKTNSFEERICEEKTSFGESVNPRKGYTKQLNYQKTLHVNKDVNSKKMLQP